jgi:peptidoglycan/LPS O-acetylase OafA/YrhL
VKTTTHFKHNLNSKSFLSSVWVGIFSVWIGSLVAILSPWLSWHHHPLEGSLIQGVLASLISYLVGITFLLLIKSAPSVETESKNIYYIPRLDHLRFLAASLVVLYHYFHTNISPEASATSLAGKLISQGSSGVDLFFVLSGFIFGTISYEKRINYGSFFVSRLFRIYPLYIVAVTIAISTHYNLFSALDCVMYLFPFLQVNHIAGNLNDFGQLWSIGLEFQFYLIFPFLAEFILKFGYRYLLALVILAVGIRLFYFNQTSSVRDLVYWSLIGRFDEFAIGILATAVAIRRPNLFKNPIHSIFSIIGVVLCLYWLESWGGYYHGIASPLWIIWPSIEGLVWAYLILSYLRSKIHFPNFISESLAKLGHLSFSIYVMHGFAVFLTFKYFGQTQWIQTKEANSILIGTLICIPLSVIIAFPTFHFIEKPFFIFKKKYTEVVSRNH